MLEQQVQDQIAVSGITPPGFRMLSTRTFPEGVVALYTAKDLSDPHVEQMGFVAFKKGMAGWKATMNGEWHRDVSHFAPEQLIDFTVSDFEFETLGKEGIFRHVLLYGQIISPQVQAIQIYLADGSTLTDHGEGGVFAIPITKTTPVCRLHVLGPGKEVLQIIDWPTIPSSDVVINRAECP